MGDALAIVLLTKKGFRPEDFAVYHPGGSLGKQVLLRISELMHADNFVPKVKEDASLKEVIMEISSKRLGMTTVVDLSGILKGIVTDGDLRRLMEGEKNIFDFRAKEIMNQKPKTITKDALAAEGLKVMEKYSITSLVILDGEKRPQGIIHLHDILKAGIV
jgi:arabinose-5-phosphate isomerase